MTYEELEKIHKDGMANKPNVYDGIMKSHLPYSPNRYSIFDAAVKWGIPKPLIDRVGVWGITEDGLECLTESYNIEKERFFEEPDYTWIDHMGAKAWVDKVEFERAFNRAVELLGVTNDWME